MTDVIGWRIDDVVAQIRGKKDTQVRLEYIPAESGVDGKHAQVTITRQKVKLEEQAAKAETITLPAADGQPERRIGVVKLPAFYQDFEGRRRNPNGYTSATRDIAKLLAQFKADGISGWSWTAEQRRRFRWTRRGADRPVHRQGAGGAGA